MHQITVDSTLWGHVVSTAKRQRRRPETVVRRALQQYLQWTEDADLLRRTERAAQRADYEVTEAEEIVRRYRRSGTAASD